MTPQGIVDQILKSGLRGRGGAGFPTGLKWKIAAAAKNDVKYIVCNADEGDPGAFMDRSVLESDPHAVIEGMIIGAYAIGAHEGYIYCRAEYPLAVHRLHLAIAHAKEHTLLGDGILGTSFSLDIRVKEGAGAFVCGEETALMASIEGNRGMPRLRPPFPAEKGIWGKPTNINNVETYANVPRIILRGADWYASLGTEKSKGTKVFALAGKIRRGGLIEVPMGMTLKEIVFDIGGGIKSGKEFKAVQMGGPSGGCIPKELVDTIIDYDSVTQTGAIMGSGGMVVVDEDTCMVEIARYFLEFTQKESCGKCTFCRVGTKRMLEILEKITKGEGRPSDLDMLQKLAVNVKMGSLCGLGQTAPNPVLTTLRYFRHEYETHINEKKCPAKQCKSLITYRIVEPACVGCGVCLKNCPAKAITGERKKLHVIDQKVCIKCGLCIDNCKFGAITVE
jgi:NADH-quinone oxidoreductase subunit F